jgi:hypothetical protein
MILLASGLGAWLALDRPLPQAWLDASGRPALDQLPRVFRPDAPERIFCAESVDTGQCSCISSDGERPDLSVEECRRRARAADTRSNDPSPD